MHLQICWLHLLMKPAIIFEKTNKSYCDGNYPTKNTNPMGSVMDEVEGIILAILFHKMPLKGCCILYNARVPSIFHSFTLSGKQKGILCNLSTLRWEQIWV